MEHELFLSRLINNQPHFQDIIQALSRYLFKIRELVYLRYSILDIKFQAHELRKRILHPCQGFPGIDKLRNIKHKVQVIPKISRVSVSNLMICQMICQSLSPRDHYHKSTFHDKYRPLVDIHSEGFTVI